MARKWKDSRTLDGITVMGGTLVNEDSPDQRNRADAHPDAWEEAPDAAPGPTPAAAKTGGGAKTGPTPGGGET